MIAAGSRSHNAPIYGNLASVRKLSKFNIAGYRSLSFNQRIPVA
jgi:hypothetical protein